MTTQAEPIWLDGDLLVRDVSSGLVPLHLVRPGDFYGAMAAPQSAYFYGGIDDVCQLAAIYAYRIAKAHALLDGNKRTAITAALVFLAVNGHTCTFAGVQADEALLALVTDMLTETEFGAFLRTNLVRNT